MADLNFRTGLASSVMSPLHRIWKENYTPLTLNPNTPLPSTALISSYLCGT